MAYYYDFRPYVSVAERRRNSEREMQKLRKNGQPVSPVVLDGRTITKTFWGKAWCENLEHYSDFANRLPRGRTYVRNGSVVDLQIAPGKVTAIVSGSALYKVAVKVSAVPKARWESICIDCAGGIDSLVELLQGRFSKGVMERICQKKSGLFPSPTEIHLSCSCPDWATMCKHVAAVLYGVGARLDEHPELLFKLREVNEKDLIAKAGKGLRLSSRGPSEDKVLAGDLSELFGLDMGTSDEDPVAQKKTLKAGPMPRLEAKPKQTATAAAAKAPTKATAKPKTATKATAKPKTATKAAAKTRAMPITATKGKPTAKPALSAKAKPKAVATVESEARAKPTLKAKAKPKAVATLETKAWAKSTLKAKAKPKAVATVETKLAASPKKRSTAKRLETSKTVARRKA